MKSLPHAALEVAVMIFAASVLLSWAWNLLQPLLPMIGVAGALAVAATYALRRNREW